MILGNMDARLQFLIPRLAILNGYSVLVWGGENGFELQNLMKFENIWNRADYFVVLNSYNFDSNQMNN